jgi:predicted ABC-class ATPase
MSIYQVIYDTLGNDAEKVMNLIGAGDVASVSKRRERVHAFLRDNEWDLETFKKYDRAAPKLPSKLQMAKNVVAAGAQAVSSGFKKVSEIERLERLVSCDSCEHIIRPEFRCSLCGCWTSYKSTLEAWHCDIDKW